MSATQAPGTVLDRSDADLIDAVRAGDLESYGELFARHQDSARRLALQLTRGSGDAEDLVSDAFAKVMEVLERGGGPDEAFRAYLLTSVRRLHVDRTRVTARVQATDDIAAYDAGVPFHDSAVAGFDNEAAAEAFASLPERWQLVLWHTEVEGAKPAEVAPLLGISPNSVAALAYRAREGLREAFLAAHASRTEDPDCRRTQSLLGGYVRGNSSRRDSTKVEDHLGIENLYEAANTPLISFLNNGIKAKELFRRDKEYVVMNGEVLIVDEHTGRILSGRRYNDGLHQAIEAKENVTVREEYQTLATVTLQNFFRLYDKLSGMTGTAMTEASEFDKIYQLGVVPIPTNRPMVRVDQPDLVYRTEEAKYEAVAEDIAEKHKTGQPILVGTVSVEKSDYLSALLKKKGVPHSVLNAKMHADEAKIVAMAGHKGAVTVATNMAGRGTDIMLGGNVEFLADAELRKQGLEPTGETAEAYDEAWPATLEKVKAQVQAEHDEVKELGGLYVLGTERHESRRIDNQLRGRSGRQGDPGESRFYLSLQDELMRLFKSDWVDRVLQVLRIPDDVPIENKRVTNAIANAQGQVEAQNFESRKNVLKYDDVMDRQRKVIYAERRAILEGADLEAQIRTFIDDVVTGYVTGATQEEDWEMEQLATALRQIFPVSLDLEGMAAAVDGAVNLDRDELIEALKADAHKAYDAREAELGEEVMRELERRVILSVLDRKWREHLYEMDYLREGIYLRAYSQRDPLVEYQREGFDMFAAVMDGIKEETVGYLFNVQVTVEEDEDADVDEDDEDVLVIDPTLRSPVGQPHIHAKGLDAPTSPANLTYSAPDESGEAEVRRDGPKASEGWKSKGGKGAKKSRKR